MWLNQSQLAYKYPTHLVPLVNMYLEISRWFDYTEPHIHKGKKAHLVFSAMKWFEKVRGGSMRLNHSELVYKYSRHLVPLVDMFGTAEPL